MLRQRLGPIVLITTVIMLAVAVGICFTPQVFPDSTRGSAAQDILAVIAAIAMYNVIRYLPPKTDQKVTPIGKKPTRSKATLIVAIAAFLTITLVVSAIKLLSPLTIPMSVGEVLALGIVIMTIITMWRLVVKFLRGIP